MFDLGKKKETDSLKAVAVGLFLIVVIAAITFFNSRTNSSSTTIAKPDLAQDSTSFAAKIITHDQLAKNSLSNSNFALLDIRNESQYRKEHIIDSINVNPSKVASPLEAIGADKKYVLIDDSGDINILNAATNNLLNSDYKNIYYLDGGFAAWKSNFEPTIGDGDPKSFTDQAKVKYITSDDLKKQMEVEKFIMIDVRQNTEFTTGHLAGAINIFLDDLEKKRRSIPLGKNILIYDDNSLGAFKGAVRLFDLGFSNTLVLSDGLDRWKNKGYELAK